MKTFIPALLAILVTFSLSAFAGFTTGEQNFASPDGFPVRKLRVNGHAVELGREIQDEYGNFSDENVNALAPLLTQALEKLPNRADLRRKSGARLTVQIVKGPRFNVERKAAHGGYLRAPTLLTIKLTIPYQALASDIALFFDENLTLKVAQVAESGNGNVADFMRNLVSPRDLNGCEMHLLNLINPY